MKKKESRRKGDNLFFIAEKMAKDFSLFPDLETIENQPKISGLIPVQQIIKQVERLQKMDIDTYIEECVSPAEVQGRVSAKNVVREVADRIVSEKELGPYYSASIELDFDDYPREIGIIAQNRVVQNGVWGPEHHLQAAMTAEGFSRRSIPVVTLMDTPGADAGSEANSNNQAHSISRLIAEMCIMGVPTLGIICGLGYSGGAIPLAASNIILSVRDGVFNTIQPRGLARIASKYNLSWQQCAKIVGVSAYDLFMQGNIDGIIDYSPGEDKDKLENLRKAIISGIISIEKTAVEVVSDNPEIYKHYHGKLERFVAQTSNDSHIATDSKVSPIRRATPTEFINVFGIAYQYTRYLGIRRRIKSITTKQYGRLARQEIPQGELEDRVRNEQQQRFLSWLQNPDLIIYDDLLNKSWHNYRDKKNELQDDRGTFKRLLLGDPEEKYTNSVNRLVWNVMLYLYNLWKGSASSNLSMLADYLQNYEDTTSILRVSDLIYPETLQGTLLNHEQPHLRLLWKNLSHECRSKIKGNSRQQESNSGLLEVLTLNFNLLIKKGFFSSTDFLRDFSVSDDIKQMTAFKSQKLRINRVILESVFPNLIAKQKKEHTTIKNTQVTILDIMQENTLQKDFISQCKRFHIFDFIYDYILKNINKIAEHASSSHFLSKSFANNFLSSAFIAYATETNPEDRTNEANRVKKEFITHIKQLNANSKTINFLQSLEQWKKQDFSYVSDALFVIVTFLFDALIPNLYLRDANKKKYDGRINPRRIGRRKDFWNQLAIAYQDLIIQNILTEQKRNSPITTDLIIEKYFSDFNHLNNDYMSSDPVSFPGFRLTIEQAVKTKSMPSGLLTGMGQFKSLEQPIKVGVAISNVAFQAGSFDMASAEKLSFLLVECARQRAPLICFISSGGMQTKEGAGALFSMAAVNDRITRFVRDQSLPVIIFGFGDCTGGAQASFVTHPLVHTYYFSGTNMPFAGQTVVRSHLPLRSSLSNYLSRSPGSMRGLVIHPFYSLQDQKLQAVDPDIPIPNESISNVVKKILSGRFNTLKDTETIKSLTSNNDLVRKITRVLIHARGCTANKLIRVAQKKNIKVVLLQSDPDMNSVAVDMLTDQDRLVCIGGNTPEESYLNGLSVVRVAENEKADALHPGIGFLSENSYFATLCRNHNINFIGPPVSSMETMGNKSNAIQTALQLGIPVIPGSHGIITSAQKAEQAANEIGYPLLIKAVHGGGGKGIKLVENSDNIDEIFHLVATEARSTFGNSDVYLEKYIPSLRHLEAQILRDRQGNTMVLGFRDCSIQNEKQKVIEESNSPVLAEETIDAITKYSIEIADSIDYVGAGTVEFIYDLKEKTVYFMEMNTRLQVEHPVTEMVSGVDIVGAQFDIAGGANIANIKVENNGYAIELRVTAEQSFLDMDGKIKLRPSPGKVTLCEFPKQDGVDVLATIANEKTVSPFYDSLVAQIICQDKDRISTIKKVRDYLNTVKISGISTNIPLLKRILDDDIYKSGYFDSGYLPDLLQRINVGEFISEMCSTINPESLINQNTLRIEGSSELKVLAPISGIFYRSISPTHSPYIAEGDEVDIYKTLCQIEAMKVFSPISLNSFNMKDAVLYPDNKYYRVVRIQYASDEQVNAGDLLFVVAPLNRLS